MCSDGGVTSTAGPIDARALAEVVALSGIRVLVVDDERAIRELVTTALEFVGAEVHEAADGATALAAVEAKDPDVVVLDVMLPDIDGFEVCERIRAAGRHTPVVFLTARADDADRVRGFVLGGDDYVTKPFHLVELALRVRSLAQRAGAATTAAPAVDGSERLRYDDLELSPDEHRVWRAGQLVPLTPTEFNVLLYLLHNAELVVSKSQILTHVWQYDFDGDGSIVESYISTLRRKLDAGTHRLIHTVRGVGYVLRRSAD